MDLTMHMLFFRYCFFGHLPDATRSKLLTRQLVNCLNALLLLTLLLTLGGCASLLRPNFTQEVAELRSGEYALDKQHSFMIFKIGHLELSKIVGRFNEFNASLDFDPESPEQMQLNGIIDVGSIDLNNSDFEDTLQEPGWFDSANFPQIVFDSTRVIATGENSFEVQGKLSMRGTTRPVSLIATFNGGADNFFTRKYTIGFSATAQVSRADFGMDTFSAFVGDTIDVELHGEFLRQ